MRYLSLFENISYSDSFWAEVEGKPSGRPTCPTCHTDSLEKEDRKDRSDVWRCKTCQNRISDADLNKSASIKVSEYGEDREFYTSGGFTEGPNGWLVYVNQAVGQRPPQSGDWAEIVQSTRQFTRPVPLTLVEEVMDGAWSFRNGHHNETPNPITAGIEDHPHPHRRPAEVNLPPRRPGQVPVKEQLCLSPVDNTTPPPAPPPEEAPVEEEKKPWWKR